MLQIPESLLAEEGMLIIQRDIMGNLMVLFNRPGMQPKTIYSRDLDELATELALLQTELIIEKELELAFSATERR